MFSITHPHINRSNLSRRVKRLTHVFMLAGVTFALTLTASALSIKPITLEMAVRGADLIVDVTISAQRVESSEDPKRGKLLKTLSALKVNQVIKGTVTAPLTVTQVGGQHQGLSQVIPGAPLFKEGQRWILFMRHVEAKSEWIVTGGQHGARQVWIRDTDQTEMVSLPPAPHPIKRLRRLRSLKSKLRALPSRKLREIPQEMPAQSDVKPAGSSPTKLSADTTSASKAQGVKSIETPSAKRSPAQTATIKIKKQPNVKLTPRAQQQRRAVKLVAYVDRLKTLVDRTQAPEHPTH